MAYTGPFPIPVKDGGTGAATLTNNCVLIGNGANAVSAFAPATNGQLIIGNTGNAPSLGNLTSTGATITITNGAGTINLEAAGGGGGGASNFITDSGTATESGGNIHINGDATNIFTTGASTNVTIALGTNISLPNTTMDGTQGIINFGGVSFINNYGSNVFVGTFSGNLTLDTGSANENVGVGISCFSSLTEGYNNNCIGQNALTSLTEGYYNFAGGSSALQSENIGYQNVAIGHAAMGFGSGAFNNTAVGFGALNGGSGAWNVCIGYNAGTSYGSTESSNILINADGTGGESNVTRIGNVTGAGDRQQNACYIAGIYGITTVSATTSAALISDQGQLGTVSSSARFKDNIQDMDSGNFMKLRPVNFTFKSDKSNTKQYGLIAEEVDKVMPEIVNYDDEGKPFSVRYHDLPAILLYEIQKLQKRIDMLERK